MLRTLIAVAFATIIAITTAVSADAENRYGKQKVVYHINYDGGPESKKYKGAMRNIRRRCGRWP